MSSSRTSARVRISTTDFLTRPSVLTHLRSVWTDHANEISLAYSGTGALKTDFTRTGKRTKMGLLDDGYKSVMRYLKNNFFDGARQVRAVRPSHACDRSSHRLAGRVRSHDGHMDAATGMAPVLSGRGPQAARHSCCKWAELLISVSRPDDRVDLDAIPPLVFRLYDLCRNDAASHLGYDSHACDRSGLLLTFLPTDYSLFYYFVLWMTLVALSLIFIFIHGIEYVNWPKLLPLSDIVHYDGPGFRSGHNGKGLGIPALDSRAVNEKAHKRAISKLEEIEMGTKSRVD